MHKVEAQRLRHRGNYMSGLQPSTVLADTDLGLRPRLVCRQAFGLHPVPFQLTASYPCTQQHTSAKRQRRDNIPAWAEGPGGQPSNPARAVSPTHRNSSMSNEYPDYLGGSENYHPSSPVDELEDRVERLEEVHAFSCRISSSLPEQGLGDSEWQSQSFSRGQEMQASSGAFFMEF